jgi:hypothetical protein
MSVPQEPSPAKLVIGVFMRGKPYLQEVASTLSEEFGRIDLVSAWMAFDYTSYYQREMGAPLYRRVFSFGEFIQQHDLADIKVATNSIEQNYGRQGKRCVNIDPGYLLRERFVLASGKNFSHRIYIGHRIYADLTLIYAKGRFQKLPWTYPDYADRPMLEFLQLVRTKYVSELKRGIA